MTNNRNRRGYLSSDIVFIDISILLDWVDLMSGPLFLQREKTIDDPRIVNAFQFMEAMILHEKLVPICNHSYEREKSTIRRLFDEWSLGQFFEDEIILDFDYDEIVSNQIIRDGVYPALFQLKDPVNVRLDVRDKEIYSSLQQNLIGNLTKAMSDVIYDKLSSVLEIDVNLLKQAGRPVDVFIPPIPAVLLDEVDSYRNLPSLILKHRKRMEKVRAKLLEYERTIRNDAVSLEHSLKALARLHKFMKILTASYSERDYTTITELRNFLNLFPGYLKRGESIDLPSLIFETLLKIPIEHILKWVRWRHILYMFSLKRKYYHIKKYNQLIQKTWAV